MQFSHISVADAYLMQSANCKQESSITIGQWVMNVDQQTMIGPHPDPNIPVCVGRPVSHRTWTQLKNGAQVSSDNTQAQLYDLFVINIMSTTLK